MAVYKRGKIWWYKFNWNGEAIRESTKQSNKRTAEQMEATHKTSLAKGEVGLRDRTSAPIAEGFCRPGFPALRAVNIRCKAQDAFVLCERHQEPLEL